jgi:pimeloyl-ACP methyl ester carboxylesterase
MPGAKPYGQLQYKDVNGKRMAYIDEDKGDAIVFQHGNPTSSYLWRNVMPHLEGLGRLVAADLIGMGASAKLDDSGPDRYHYAEQRDYLFALWDSLDLGDRVIFVLHDWGSALGFDWANQHRDRVAGIAYMEAIAMPVNWDDWPDPGRRVFQGFRSPEGEAMCSIRISSLSVCCPVPSSANLPMRRWITTANRSAIPARIVGRPCPGRATSRSRASRPTSSPSSKTTEPGFRNAMCPSSS